MANLLAAFVAVLAVASQVSQIAAEDFLKSRTEVAVDKEDVKQFLLAELSRKDVEKLTRIEADLLPLFATLPKNVHGRLEPSLVRYALNRHFVKTSSWYVKGLHSHWLGNESSPSTILKARAPGYIQNLFEEQFQGRGLGLHELAVFAATLADLIHTEAVGELEWAHHALGLPLIGPLKEAQADAAIDAFLVSYLLLRSKTEEDASDLPGMKTELLSAYPDFHGTDMWLQDFKRTYALSQQSRRNPFVAYRPSFQDSAALVIDFSHKFGSFQKLECHALKQKLLDMELAGTGRVRLADFYYSSAIDGGFEFSESVEYLRNQGALDERDPQMPSVVIPNYVNSLANCLAASNFYAVCCDNECNELMAHVEKAIAAPRALPAQIVKVIANLHSDTVDAPRNLSSTLLSRLDQIAEHHGGDIPLHGRLFAQWMHHAYPRECPFPHITGDVNPMAPEEFAIAIGEELLDATSDEMMKYVQFVNESRVVEALPWSDVEEELVVRTGRRRTLKIIAAVVALVSFAMPLMRALHVAMSTSSGKDESHLV